MFANLSLKKPRTVLAVYLLLILLILFQKKFYFYYLEKLILKVQVLKELLLTFLPVFFVFFELLTKISNPFYTFLHEKVRIDHP